MWYHLDNNDILSSSLFYCKFSSYAYLQAIGYITSGCYSYRIGRGVAFAYVPYDLAEPGTRLEVEIQGKLAPAVVTYPAASEEYIDIDIGKE